MSRFSGQLVKSSSFKNEGLQKASNDFSDFGCSMTKAGRNKVPIFKVVRKMHRHSEAHKGYVNGYGLWLSHSLSTGRLPQALAKAQGYAKPSQ